MSLDVNLIRKEPLCTACGRGGQEEYVYDANITHNLHMMATQADLECVWNPEEFGITTAAQMIAPLEAGIARMRTDPDSFRQLEPDNKWGTYDDFLPWLEQYLQACKDYPEAEVRASR